MTNRRLEVSTELSLGSSERADGSRKQQQRQGAFRGVQQADGHAPSREASTSSKNDADATFRSSDRSLPAMCSNFSRARTTDSSPIALAASLQMAPTAQYRPSYHSVRKRNTRDFLNSRQKIWTGGGGTESERVLDAAALQDKLLRSMKLGLGGRPQALLFERGGGVVGMDISRRKRWVFLQSISCTA